jgi:hypothetical protein
MVLASLSSGLQAKRLIIATSRALPNRLSEPLAEATAGDDCLLLWMLGFFKRFLPVF